MHAGYLGPSRRSAQRSSPTQTTNPAITVAKAAATGQPQQGELFDNWVWEDSQDAIIAGSGDPEVREGVLRILATLPGVTAVGGTGYPPGDSFSDGSYFIDRLDGSGVGAPQAVFSVMTPGAFAALGIPLKRGRDFNEGDAYDAPFTAVINEALARKSFPGQDPLGRTIYCGLDSMKPMKIVGVVGDVRQYGQAAEPWPEIVMPYEQHPYRATGLNILVRAPAGGNTLWGPIQRKVRARSAEVPVKFTSMDDLLAENTAAPRFRTLLLGIFAAIAVCLAMAGVYGVVAYTVGQRAGEIGLRPMRGGGRRGNRLR